MQLERPAIKPYEPFFSSGPTPKPPSWSPDLLHDAFLGRSHRDPIAVEKIYNLLQRQKSILGIPDDYQIGVFTGSNTGAFEAALWNLLGSRPVDVVVFDNFSRLWYNDAQQLLDHQGGQRQAVRMIGEPFKELPALDDVSDCHDVILTWHGTPAGMIIPHSDFIPPSREGLVFVDATSAAFCLDLPWEKFDVVSWSWQKALGGEAGFGVLAFSPKALAQLEKYTPPWHIPSIFNLKRTAKTSGELFAGKTLNTVSMLAFADADFVTSFIAQYGLEKAIRHSWDGLHIIEDWLRESQAPFSFLIKDEKWRSPVAITLETPACPMKAYEIAALLSQENIAYDLKGHVASPPCIRIWNGPTVTHENIKLLLPWLEWAYHQTG